MRRILALAVFLALNPATYGAVSSMPAAAAGAGNACVTRADNAAAALANPAVIALMGKGVCSLTTGYTSGGSDRDNGFLAFACHDDNLGFFGASAVYDDGGYAAAAQGADRGQFSSSFSATYANRLFYLLTYGISLKGSYDYTGRSRTFGLSSDMGLTYQPFAGIEFFIAGALRDWPALIYESAVRVEIPCEYSLGASLLLLNGWVTLDYEAVMSGGEPSVTSRAGLELDIAGTVAVRTGIDGMEPTFGAGVTVKGYSLDYAYCRKGTGGTHSVSLNIIW